MTIIVDPTAWTGFGGSPPFWWEALATDDRWWLYNNTGSGGGGDSSEMIWDTVTPFDAGTLTFRVEIITPRPSGDFTFQYRINGGLAQVNLGNIAGIQDVPVIIPPGMTTFRWSINTDSSTKLYNGVVAVGDAGAPAVSKRVIQWTRARVITPRVEQYKIYRGLATGALSLLATVQVNFERIPDYDFLHPNRFIDETADAATVYRYRVDAITADGRTLAGNIFTSTP